MTISVFYDHVKCAAENANCSVAEILTTLHAAGICGIDFIYTDYAAECSFLHPLLTSLNIKVASLISFTDFAHGVPASSLFPVVDTAASVGCRHILIIPGFRREEEDDGIIIERISEELNILTAYAAKHDVYVTLEDYDDTRTTYQNSAGLCAYMRRVTGLACTFDTGNFIPVGETTEKAFAALKDYIVHVHCKDRMRDTNRVRVFGQGDVDFLSFFRLLRSIDYAGALTIEQYCEEGSTKENLVSAAISLKKLWDASELV